MRQGITGYEVQTSGLYGMVTGIAEGSLYIDVDNDSHSVLSLGGDSDVAREYFLSTGMISSLYESTVWEEITGEESVSTISILAKASEENIDILLLSKENLSEEIEKLNTDEATRQSIINAVNSGMIVTVPAEKVTMGDWSGTGYIVTNPATGAGEYMISGGLNGGAVAAIAAIPMLLATFSSVLAAEVLIIALTQFLATMITPFLFGTGVILLALIFVAAVELNRLMWTDYMDYIFTDDFDSYEEACHMASRLGEYSLIGIGITNYLCSEMYELDSLYTICTDEASYIDQLNNLPPNKISHIIEGSKGHNHHWERLVPNKNWEKIKTIIVNVMKTGEEMPYKTQLCKHAIIYGNEIVVTYTKLPDGRILISNAWVIE